MRELQLGDLGVTLSSDLVGLLLLKEDWGSVSVNPAGVVYSI